MSVHPGHFSSRPVAIHCHQDTSNVPKPKVDQESEKNHFVCVRMHRFMCVQVHVCGCTMHACMWRSESNHGYRSSFTIYFGVWEQVLSLPRRSPLQLSWRPRICMLHTESWEYKHSFCLGPGDQTLVLRFVWWAHSRLNYHTGPSELQSSVSHTEVGCHEGEGKRRVRERNPFWIIGSGILSD